MKEFYKHMRICSIIVSLCTLILGIIMIIKPDVSALLICYILAFLMLVSGIYEIIRYFKLGVMGLFFRFDLGLGLCNLLIGFLLLIHPHGVLIFLPIAIALSMLIESVFDIQLAVEMKDYQMRDWWLSLVLGLIGIIVAILLLMNPMEGSIALIILLGISLMIYSIQSLYLIFCISRFVKDYDEDHIIEAKWKTIDK